QGQLLGTLNLAEINAQVTQSKQAVDKAQRDLRRAQNLYEDTVVTLEQVENSQTAFEVARAGLRIARFNQNYARIVAPASGKILKRFVENHELVNPGSPILALAGTGENAFVLRIGVADRDIVKLQANDSAMVRFDAYPGEVFSAVVTELAEAADPLTGTFEVELTVLENKRILKNGFIGKVTLFPSRQQPYYRIAVNALVEGDQQWAKVFVPDSSSQTARPLLVRPDHIGEQYFTVLASEWDDKPQVITEGSAYLKAGAPYIVTNP
ncbi:MAG: efflux RND transporter periplasmic adaptor subunit, partial [Cyclobacteriaceae bacterium]